jgi:hypothetical protein
LNVQLLAGQLELASIDAVEVRRKFVSNAEPEYVRREALDALIALRTS